MSGVLEPNPLVGVRVAERTLPHTHLKRVPPVRVALQHLLRLNCLILDDDDDVLVRRSCVGVFVLESRERDSIRAVKHLENTEQVRVNAYDGDLPALSERRGRRCVPIGSPVDEEAEEAGECSRGD